MRLLALILPLALSACIAVVPVYVPIGPQPPDNPVPLLSGPGAVDSFGRRLNTERARAGTGPVVRNPMLEAAAMAHARDMAGRGYFAHRSPEGRGVGDRARAQGYVWCQIAENLAQGQTGEAQVLADWMASTGHRRNNLRSNVDEYGLARVGETWVLVLGRRC
ncbi:CAP domain-containing protein [Loktanella sp. IMCC34160]|uniref:CAP domain-containing protein n=1 Tax=Loktanella sp. IMCC34160 TaxID=2510646 RepID=UPI00101C1A99|nr:CAP domain-containing protein [Loktanella sp. IMCC34160]RYG90666.1 CAP domain-containing protein [Loktanella sp. IMCC34160]